MRFFDSNVWIAYFDGGDSQHTKAARILRQEPHYGITEYCVVETASILAKKCGAGAADTFLDHTVNNIDVTIMH